MKKAFSVYDNKAGFYMAPFFLQSTAEGIRSFTDAANDPHIAISKHPEDYTLFELGSFDDQTGVFTQHVAMIPLGCAAEFVVRGQAN